MTISLAHVVDCIGESLGFVLPDIEDDAGAVFLGSHALDGILLLLRDGVLDILPGLINSGYSLGCRLESHLQSRLLLLPGEEGAVDHGGLEVA